LPSMVPLGATTTAATGGDLSTCVSLLDVWVWVVRCALSACCCREGSHGVSRHQKHHFARSACTLPTFHCNE
jgi:hypothetical protein